MAVTPSLLTSGNNTAGGASFDTASVSPTSDQPILLCCEIFGNPAGGTTASVSGAGLTWTQRASVFHSNSGGNGTNFQRIYVWTGVSASPSSGAITVTPVADFDAALWYVVDLASASSTPYVQSVVSAGNDSGTTATVTLAAFASATNCAISFSTFFDSGETLTADANYTAFTFIDRPAFSTQAAVQYRANDSDLSPAVTKTGGAADWLMIALEIAEAGGGEPPASGKSFQLVTSGLRW